MMNMDNLMQRVSAVAPIDGISIGIENDKSTWRIDFKPEATVDQRAAAQAAIAAFVVTDSPRIISPRELRMRLPQAAQDAIDAAAMTNKTVFTWRLRAAEAQEIDLDNPETAAGLDFLISMNLITEQDKATVLA